MICITANQQLRELLPRVNSAERRGIEQSANLQAMSKIMWVAHLKFQQLGPQYQAFAAKIKIMASLYYQAAANPQKAAVILNQAQQVQEKFKVSASRAGLIGCGRSALAYDRPGGSQ